MRTKRIWISLRRFLLTTLALFCAAIFLIVLGYFAVGVLVGSGDEVVVPNVVGQDSGAALEILLAAGLQPALPIKEEHHDEIALGNITTQEPLPGTRVKRGRHVVLVKSLGSQKVPVPSLVGLDLRGAEWELRRSGLRLGQIVGVPHERVEAGLIIAHEPLGGARATKGGLVDLLLSEGAPDPLLILPNVQGRKAAEVRAELERAGFEQIREQLVVAPRHPPGMVLGQHPRPGVPLTADQEVILSVSTIRTGQGKVRYRYLSYCLPPALGPGRTEVLLLDDFGLRTVLVKTLKRGGRLEFIERLVGDTALVIYQDGMRVADDLILE